MTASSFSFSAASLPVAVPARRGRLEAMTTTLITGANKRLGREAARQLIAAGHTVYIGFRDEQRGKETAGQIGARLLVVDVTSDESVQAAAAQVRQEEGHLDVLVNNAGIAGGGKAPPDVTAADMQAVFGTNVVGVVRVTHAVLPLLAASDGPVIVNGAAGGTPLPTFVARRRWGDRLSCWSGEAAEEASTS